MVQRGAAEEAVAMLERAAAAAAPAAVSFDRGSLANMETSGLAFNERVLDLVNDPRVPLLERVRFLSILGGNLDEFFMTRVAGFKRQVAMGNEKPTLDGMSPHEQLHVIRDRARKLFATVYHESLPALFSDLAVAGLDILSWNDLRDDERAYLHANYRSELDAVVIPVEVPPGGPFPHVRNLRPALLVGIRPEEGDPERLVVLELPNDVSRLVPLPGGRRFIPLEAVIRANLPRLFQGGEVLDVALFRVTRSGNLSLDSESVDDILEAVAENVAQRPFQPVVRIEVEDSMTAARRKDLLRHLRAEAETRLSALDETDIYPISGLIDLRRLEEVAGLPIPGLRYPPRRRSSPFRPDRSIFAHLDAREILVRFPAHSFERTVERFLQEAADDPAVEAIQITLYRTSRSSRIVRLLRRAHANGKRIVALIEVKASFDERRNIEWARALEGAGIRVLYGPSTLKVHAKIASVTRREGDVRTFYSYVGTGNLNAATAATYTDLGLFTADQEIGREIDDLFATMAGDRPRADYDRLLVAPFNMRRRFLALIEREIEHARDGRTGGMTIKLNGIADREVIDALHRAAQAGVRIDLIVRGICALRPGVPGMTEGIRVVAIAGRFLEHSRIFRFENAGQPEYLIGSADWRGRNLGRRIEVVVPVRRSDHREVLDRILRADLECPSAWEMQPDGSYVRRNGEPHGPRPGPGGAGKAE